MMDETPLQLYGHTLPAERFIKAAQSGRLHHAWMLTGTKGIGKASFAWQAAAYVLSNAYQETGFLEPMAPLVALYAAAQSQAASQIQAGSHPDFRYVTPDTSKAKAQISVEQIRTMASMFVTTAGMGGWRIAVIDAADDMNRNAANAILKLLEEPPAQCLFFLISHAPGRLLPTIRSRCQVLPFSPLSHDETRDIVAARSPSADALDVETVLALAYGSPGKALELLESNAADYVVSIDQIFQNLPSLDRQTVLGLADMAGDRTTAGPFEVIWELIEARVHYAVKACATGNNRANWTDALPLSDWISLQERLQDRKGQASGLNLSPRHVLISLFSDIDQRLSKVSARTAY